MARTVTSVSRKITLAERRKDWSMFATTLPSTDTRPSVSPNQTRMSSDSTPRITVDLVSVDTENTPPTSPTKEANDLGGCLFAWGYYAYFKKLYILGSL